MRVIRSFLIALSTYSKIPVPQVEWNEENNRYTMCFFSVIGIVIGAVLGIWLWISEHLELGALLKGTIAAAVPLLITGGIHMDGFMDTEDAMSSWKSMEERRAILKDSHVGAFAVMKCAVYLMCIAGIMSEARFADIVPLTACFVLSRASSALAMTWLRKTGHTGMMTTMAEKMQNKTVTAACAIWMIGAAVALLVFGRWGGASALVGNGIVLALYRHRAYKYFGGVSGDLAGWYLQTAELVCLACVILGRCVIS